MESIDYKALANSRLTDQFRFDQAFLALIDTLITHREKRQQEYKDFAETFLDIDKSKGKALDAIGKIVGQDRKLVNFIQEPYFGFQGARFAEAFDVGYWYSLHKARLGTIKVVNDEQYRRLLKARIMNNRSRCTRDEHLAILNMLTGNNQSQIQELQHGVFEVSLLDSEDGLASYFLSKYRDKDTMFSIPLGYRLKLRYQDSAPEPISCEGATSSISFSHIQGDWRFYLDNFENSVISGLANDFSVYLNTEMDGKFISDFDGFFFIDNLDVLPHRFKMVPLDGEVPPEYTYSGENPTFMEHEDGSLTFCLAEKETPVSCYNFTQEQINNKPVFEKGSIFMAVNYKEPNPDYALYLDIQPSQLDDFFTISVNDVPTLFSDLLVNLGEDAGYNVYWFRGDTSPEFNPYISQQGLFIGYTADNTISFLYSNPSNTNDVAVIKICSKVQTAVPTHLNYPEYRSIWFVDPFGEGPRFSAIDHLLYNIDENGFEIIVLKIQASNS